MEEAAFELRLVESLGIHQDEKEIPGRKENARTQEHGRHGDCYGLGVCFIFVFLQISSSGQPTSAHFNTMECE